jgi:hypothetical protein
VLYVLIIVLLLLASMLPLRDIILRLLSR